MIKYLMLRVKSQKQYDNTLSDLREVGVDVRSLSGYERLTRASDQTVIGYTISAQFCSDGVGTESKLLQDTVKLYTSRKEFITAIKAQRSGGI